MIKRIVAFVLLLFVFCTSGKGQDTSYGPNSMVRTIRQDRNRNIWLASVEGIIRYNGKSFTNITSKVMAARFFCVLEDRKGNFWFSSIGSGVWYYDGESFLNFTTREGLASDRVFFIYEDKSGNIWFSTEGGASCYNGKFFRNYRMNGGSVDKDVNSKDDNDVNSTIEDKNGKFWFGTRGRAFTYDGKTFTIPTHDGRPFVNIRCIIEDKRGNIWLGGSDGLWRYDGSTFINFTQNFVCYVYEDRNGNIWTTSQSGKDKEWTLSRYDEASLSSKKPTVTNIKSQSEMLLGILEDDRGNIWFGSGDGVYRYDGKIITDF